MSGYYLLTGHRFVAAVLALSLAGALISGYLVKHEAQIWSSSAAEADLLARFCSAAGGGEVDCDAALRSDWAKLALPIPMFRPELAIRWVHIPIAFLGLAYFVFLGAWFGLTGVPRPQEPGWVRHLPRVLSLLGAAASCFYIGLMMFSAAPWCLACVSIHLINFVTAYLIHRTGPGTAEKKEILWDSRRANHRAGLKAVAVGIVLVLGLWSYYRQTLFLGAKLNEMRVYKAAVDQMRRDEAFLLREYLAEPQYDIPRRKGEGDSAWPRLVIFTDYECGACKCAARTAEQLVAKKLGGRLNLDFRHYPLCSTCNDGVNGEYHPNACAAARAAEAARRLGGEEAFRKMSELLFEHRSELNGALYRRLAESISLDSKSFLDEMNGPAVRDIIQADVAMARTMGVRGTPAIYLDGRRVSPLCQTPVFWEAIAQRTVDNLPVIASGRESTPDSLESDPE
jgi:uncharacterized membrane protein